MLKLAVTFGESSHFDAVEDRDDLERRFQPCIPDDISYRLGNIRLGNEFCERLMPSSNQTRNAIFKADRFNLPFSLVLSNLTDKGHKKLKRLLPVLPDNTDVTVNDWGTAALVSSEYPNLSVTAGRLLCKHLKEARISTPDADPEVVWPISSKQFQKVLGGLGIQNAEVDLAPHTRPPAKKTPGFSVSLHLQRGYSAKSHVCKVGSINLPPEKKFAPGHLCRRECLDYVSPVIEQPHPKKDALPVFQRGNTWFYEYSERMNAAIATAIENSVIDQAIVTLD
ncbi:MAG: hypothetical protein ISR45_05625 [Rhodospirillales bacterium]|nr:hypothetical protein [Rhodospirillales bacterium]